MELQQNGSLATRLIGSKCNQILTLESATEFIVPLHNTHNTIITLLSLDVCDV